MKHTATRELFRYWNELRGARAAPERCDIDPAAIRSVLPDTFMLDVAADFPIRLAGTRVEALFGGAGAAGGRGGFLDLWQAEERHNLAAMLDAVADGASPMVVGASGAPAGQRACALELLFLPLRHFGKTHSRMLGIVSPAVTPEWLGLAPVGPLAIRSLRVVVPGEMPYLSRGGFADEVASPAPSRDEAASPVVFGRIGALAAAGRPIPGRPALRLITGGRTC